MGGRADDFYRHVIGRWCECECGRLCVTFHSCKCDWNCKWPMEVHSCKPWNRNQFIRLVIWNGINGTSCCEKEKENTRRSNWHYLICLNTRFHWISAHRQRYIQCMVLLVPQQPYYYHSSTVKTRTAQSNTESNNAPNQVKAIVPMPFGHTMCGATCYVLSALRDIAPKQIQWMVLFLFQHKKQTGEIETRRTKTHAEQVKSERVS